ncbi:methyltransferase domain-containing protein [Brucella anthropi]|uniref:class I SAM-dependent methyltransferase n=1 Tax=Brucella anthropi TaxID=529 RepID=UPI0026716B55|nr:methyltransferase domain-containing protein [Brucella anthropi]WKT93660.1 methyltransferase domain-containing protein [Brucella anthropi]
MTLDPVFHLRPKNTGAAPLCVVERNSCFQGAVHISGFVIAANSKVLGLNLKLPDGRELVISQHSLPSPDLSRVYGRSAAACRFNERIFTGLETAQMLNATIEVCLADGSRLEQPLSAADPHDPVLVLVNRFFDEIHQCSNGHMLEIGSRNRTGAMWRERLPAAWQYTGFDILEGENVDVFGDAHEASSFLPRNQFDAVMSFAVFEHLLMPWKAVIEMNRVMKPGAIGIILAPQTWPLHEEPCDYFRFSRHSWKALLNRATGFEIIKAVDGCDAYIVAKVHNLATSFGEFYTGALMSAVFFRKTGETNLDWPVSLSSLGDDLYPM